MFALRSVRRGVYCTSLLCTSYYIMHRSTNKHKTNQQLPITATINCNNLNLFEKVSSKALCEAYIAYSGQEPHVHEHDTIDEFLEDLVEDDLDTHFHLASEIEDAKALVEPHKMLDIFRVMYQTGEDISLDFLIEMFYQAGIEDHRIARRLFAIMDRNKDGQLQPSEILAVLALFAGGDVNKRSKFLFRCLDLDGGGTVDKQEFRSVLTCILEARFHMSGLSDPFDADEIFSNIFSNEFHTVAKFKANRIVRDIFLIADTNRDGELSMKEFLYWCKRGNKEVRLLENAMVSPHEAMKMR